MVILDGAIGDALPRLRDEANARMRDVFDIGTLSAPTYNPTTGNEERTFTAVFRTIARLRATRTYGNQNLDVAGRVQVVVTRELHIPWDSPAVEVGMVARPVTLDATTDPTVVGDLRITGPAPGSQTTARRLEVTEALT